MKEKFSKTNINIIFGDISKAADLFNPLSLVLFSVIIFLMP